MKKIYEVVWAKTAENDLLKIIEYIAQSNPGNALRILKKIKKQVADLYYSPERCRIVPELYDHGITQYREMVYCSLANNVSRCGFKSFRIVGTGFKAKH